LNVIPIFIPPLRQRPEDLPLLCDRLIKKLNQEYGRCVDSVSPEVMEVFKAYRWPGNVRELENVLGRAMMNMKFQETVILPEHLPPLNVDGDRPVRPVGREAAEAGAPSAPWLEGSLKEAVQNAERLAILNALKKTGNNKTRAARLLGISVRSLYNKIEQYGIGKEAPEASS